MQLSSTSIRIKEDTYKMIIKMRGILEQLFKRKLTIDDTVYLSSRLMSYIYEAFQKLDAQNLIEISEVRDGSIEIQGTDEVMKRMFPEIIEEVTEIKFKLEEKEQKKSTLAVVVA